MARDHFKVKCHLFAYTVDVGYHFNDKQRLIVTGDKVKAPWTDGEPFGDIETCRYHYTGDQLELAILRHCRKEWI
jgi:hypothetical protein